jgi:hypothetical protein
MSKYAPPPVGTRITVVSDSCEGMTGYKLVHFGEEVDLTIKSVDPGPPPTIQATINDGKDTQQFSWIEVWRGVEGYVAGKGPSAAAQEEMSPENARRIQRANRRRFFRKLGL